MPTSATGVLNKPRTVNNVASPPNRQHHQQRGFTLLEIIVVLLVIGVISSLVTLSFAPLSGKTLKTEAQKLTQLVEYASQEAVLTSTPQKLTINQTHYQFQKLEQGLEEDTWIPIEEGLLRPRQFSERIHLDLAADEGSTSEPSFLPSEGKTSTGDSNLKDSKHGFNVFFLSSGEISPFEITFSEQDNPKQFILSADNAGNIRLETVQ